MGAVSKYNNKDGTVDFLDMVSMYYSISHLFGEKPKSMDLHNFMKENKLGNFGYGQYELLKKYIKDNLGD
ncbi:MAG: hypothetical protein PF542_01250 [Nanoarchaeota archaeon]|jgi:hypothetical protein|nr:hypothetical protein [Nanoarchaeota archaeon]